MDSCWQARSVPSSRSFSRLQPDPEGKETKKMGNGRRAVKLRTKESPTVKKAGKLRSGETFASLGFSFPEPRIESLMMQRLTFPFPFVHHQTHDWLLSVLECQFLSFDVSSSKDEPPAMESGTTINRGNEN